MPSRSAVGYLSWGEGQKQETGKENQKLAVELMPALLMPGDCILRMQECQDMWPCREP